MVAAAGFVGRAPLGFSAGGVVGLPAVFAGCVGVGCVAHFDLPGGFSGWELLGLVFVSWGIGICVRSACF